MYHKIILPQAHELIIQQIGQLIKSGQMKPADRLPSEMQLQKIFGVSKTQLKMAMNRLNHCGVLTIKPQSGIYLASYSPKILIDLIDYALTLKEPSSGDLYEVRLLLETEAVRLALSKTETCSVQGLNEAHQDFIKKAETGARAVEEDFYFHLMMMQMAQNSVLNTIYSSLAPQIINFLYEQDNQNEKYLDERTAKTLEEHNKILEALKEGNLKTAVSSLQEHLKNAHTKNEIKNN